MCADDVLYNNINIIDLNRLFVDTIQAHILDSMYNLKLCNGVLTKEVKLLFYHHVIYDLCEEYMSSVKRSIVFFNYTDIPTCQLCEYLNKDDILSILSSIISKIEKLLPIKIYKSTCSFENLKQRYFDNDGRAINIINHLTEYLITCSKSSMTFENIKKFTKKYGLLYLNQDYFNRITTKQLFIS